MPSQQGRNQEVVNSGYEYKNLHQRRTNGNSSIATPGVLAYVPALIKRVSGFRSEAFFSSSQCSKTQSRQGWLTALLLCIWHSKRELEENVITATLVISLYFDIYSNAHKLADLKCTLENEIGDHQQRNAGSPTRRFI
jgi:hypothetical protein